MGAELIEDQLKALRTKPGSRACCPLTARPLASNRREHVLGRAVVGLDGRQLIAADAQHGALGRCWIGQHDVFIVVCGSPAICSFSSPRSLQNHGTVGVAVGLPIRRPAR